MRRQFCGFPVRGSRPAVVLAGVLCCAALAGCRPGAPEGNSPTATAEGASEPSGPVPGTSATESPAQSSIDPPEQSLGNEVAMEAEAASVAGPPVADPPRKIPPGPAVPRKQGGGVRADGLGEEPVAETIVTPPETTSGASSAPTPVAESSEVSKPDLAVPGGLLDESGPDIANPGSVDAISVPATNPPVDGEAEIAPSGPAKGKGKGKGKGGGGGEPFDPIKENGPHFVDWPKPDLAIVASGCLNGYLEPCGCAGMDRMKGGLMRRYTFMEELRRDRGWNTVAVDTGGIPKRFGPQAVCKYRVAYESYRKMGYAALGLGVTDLRLPIDELISIEGDEPLLVCANVAFFGNAMGIPKRFQVVDAGAYKVGVTAVMEDDLCKSLHNPDLECLPSAQAIEGVLAEFEKEGCNLAVLLAYGPRKWALQLAERFPRFRFVITSDGAPEPPPKPAPLGGGRYLIEVGEKGMYATLLGVYANDPEIRYQKVTLDSRYASAKEVDALMRQYQTELELRGLGELGVKAQTHPDAQRNGDYVGSKKCEACHEESYKIWKKSKHAHAWESLFPPYSDPARNHDPECISCHVVGWHPTEYFPYKTGYLNEKETPHLLNVGCESCHGPGGEHVKAEMGSDRARQEAAREAVRVTLKESNPQPGDPVTSKACYSCHDLDNSPDFNFDTYWPDVEHKETE